jgi:hypothetical protein
MTEEKRTCGQCMKFEKHPHKWDSGCCTADIPAWVGYTFGKIKTSDGSVIGGTSLIAEECDLFNPIKKG